MHLTHFHHCFALPTRCLSSPPAPAAYPKGRHFVVIPHVQLHVVYIGMSLFWGTWNYEKGGVRGGVDTRQERKTGSYIPFQYSPLQYVPSGLGRNCSSGEASICIASHRRSVICSRRIKCFSSTFSAGLSVLFHPRTQQLITLFKVEFSSIFFNAFHLSSSVFRSYFYN